MLEPGMWIVCRIKKITLGKDGYVYIALEVPEVEPPFINVPTLRVDKNSLDLVEKWTFDVEKFAEFVTHFRSKPKRGEE